MIHRRLTCLALLPLIATACSSGVSSLTPRAATSQTQQQQPQAAAGANVPAQVRVVIPDGSRRTGSTARRTPLYVSQGSAGLKVTAYAQSDTKQATPLASSQTSIVQGSSACAQVSGGRSCSVSLSTPPGNDTFVVQVYDTAPAANGQIPSTAKLLSTGTAGLMVTSNQNNTITVTLDGVLASLSLGGVPLLPSSQGSVATTVVIPAEMLDADGYTIASGATDDHAATPASQDDVLSSPVTVSVLERLAAGDTSHATLLVDGATSPLTTTSSPTTYSDGSKTIVSSYVTDVTSHTFAVQYDGRAMPGYKFNASLSTTASGVASVASAYAPLFVTAAQQPYVTQSSQANGVPSVNFQGSGESATLAISEYGDGTKPYTGAYYMNHDTIGDCTKFPGATIGASSNGTAQLTFTSVDSTGGTCYYQLTDGTTTITVPVTSSPPGSTGSANLTEPIAGKYLFIGDFQGDLTEFDARANGTGTTGTTSVTPLNATPPGTTGISGLADLKVDPIYGFLIAADQLANKIDIYKTFPFTSKPDVVITLPTPANGSVYAEGIAVDQGTLYVSMSNGVLSYANYASLSTGTPSPTAQLAVPGTVDGIASNGGNLYVATSGGTLVYPERSLGTTSAPAASLTRYASERLAFDAYGNLYASRGGTLYVYPASALQQSSVGNTVAPTESFAISDFGFSATQQGLPTPAITSLAVDAAGRVYVIGQAISNIAPYFTASYQYAPLTDLNGNLTVQPQLQRFIPSTELKSVFGYGQSIVVY